LGGDFRGDDFAGDVLDGDDIFDIYDYYEVMW